MWNTPTKDQLSRIPRCSSQLENGDLETRDIVMYLHFFLGACDWWIAEYDGDDVFYGFACLGDSEMAEWGSISFSELQELVVQVPITDEQSGATSHLPVEVDTDLFWTPTKFGDIDRVRLILAAQRREP